MNFWNKIMTFLCLTKAHETMSRKSPKALQYPRCLICNPTALEIVILGLFIISMIGTVLGLIYLMVTLIIHFTEHRNITEGI